MEKARFQNLVDQLSSVATLEHWEPLYDRQLDFFYWKRHKLSKDVKMVKMSHETHFYLSPSGKVEGVLVEYLKGNFIEHNGEYRGMTKHFTRRVDGGEYTVQRKSKDLEAYFDKFAESLKADIYKEAMEDRKTPDEMDFVIAQALAS